MESSNEYSNFVTPPDTVTDIKHTVLVVNAEQADITALAMFCKASAVYFNIYFYNTHMQDTEWFERVLAMADAVILNADYELADQNPRLLAMKKAWYYGKQADGAQARLCGTVLDYFVNYVENR